MRRREFIKAVAAMAAVGLEAGARAAEPQAMPRRKLGKTGVEVSALALGGVIGMQRPPARDHDPAAIAEAAILSVAAVVRGMSLSTPESKPTTGIF